MQMEISKFLGEESAANLRIAFATVAQQLADLTSVDDIPVELFLTGDLMFLSRSFGHRGPASAFPCICCEVNKLPAAPGQMRTIARMKQQAETFQQGQQAGENATSLSKRCAAMQYT